MKKLFLLCCFLGWSSSNAFAQNGYVKHTFEAGLSESHFKGWDAKGLSNAPFTDGAYTFFLNKNIGIRASYHVNTREIKKEAIPAPYQYPYRYVDGRRIKCWDILTTYRLNHKRHSLLASAGLSWRKDMSLELYTTPFDFGYLDYENKTAKSLGYSLSLSYQYRIFRNFGVSGEILFRQSKNIPDTFTYGIRFAYLIWNKRKEK
jgi:hypothetical protein